MSKVRKVAKNTIINFSSAFVVAVFQLLFNIILARYFGSAGYGFISYAISFIFILLAFNDLGLSTIAIKDVASDEKLAGKYISNLFAFRGIVSLIIFFIALAFVSFLQPDPVQKISMLLFVLSALFFMLMYDYRWIFQALQVFEYDGMLNIIHSIIMLLMALSVVFFKKGLIAIAFGWALVYFFSFTLGLIIVLRMSKHFRLSLDPVFIKKLFIPALPIGAIVIFSILYTNIDKILLFQMKGGTDVGWYSAAGKFVLFFRGLVAIYMPVILPALANFHAENNPYFDKLLKRSFNYILMTTLAVSVVGTILARPIILFIFGAGFEGAIISLQIILWAVPFLAISMLFMNAFICIDRQKENLIVVIFVLIFNLIFNLIFIPQYGYIATSVVMFLSEVLMFAVLLSYSYKYLKFKVPLRKIFQICASLFVMGFFTRWMYPASFLVNIFLSALVYFTALIAFRGIDVDDWNLLKKIYLKQI